MLLLLTHAIRNLGCQAFNRSVKVTQPSLIMYQCNTKTMAFPSLDMNDEKKKNKDSTHFTIEHF